VQARCFFVHRLNGPGRIGHFKCHAIFYSNLIFPERAGTGTDTSALAELQRRRQVLSAPHRNPEQCGSGGRVYQWAVADHSDVSDFHVVVPQPAIHFPFELDVFQKQAVMHLEKVRRQIKRRKS
jgi:hypothetical protein